jgi:predicted ATPase
LHLDCERQLRVPLLPAPPPSSNLTAEEAIKFPAVELFMARAAMAVRELELSDRDAPVAASLMASGSPSNRRQIFATRTALTWAFAPTGDPSLGIALAIASAPLWLDQPLLAEFRGWMKKVVSGLKFLGRAGHPNRTLGAASGTPSSSHQLATVRNIGSGRRDGGGLFLGASGG